MPDARRSADGFDMGLEASVLPVCGSAMVFGCARLEWALSSERARAGLSSEAELVTGAAVSPPARVSSGGRTEGGGLGAGVKTVSESILVSMARTGVFCDGCRRR